TPERVRGRRFSVYDEDFFRRTGNRLEPGDEPTGIGMGGRVFELRHFAQDVDVFAVHLEAAFSGHEVGTARTTRLVTGEENQVARIAGDVADMMQHATAGSHARSTEDDGRSVARGALLQFFRFFT